MTQLLVSVRSAEEAEAAIAGGADLIDVKEPARGALGRADDGTIAAIVRQVASRKPVSAALGELGEAPRLPPDFKGLVKIGLAGCGVTDWKQRFRASEPAARARANVVPVAYADWPRATAPPPDTVFRLAADHGCATLLIDTYIKDGRSLLDWLAISALREIRDACRSAGIRLALAGSLQEPQIARLLPLEPDIIAVRGAACAGGARHATVSASAVSRLASLIHGRSRKLISTISVDESARASFGNHLSTIP